MVLPGASRYWDLGLREVGFRLSDSSSEACPSNWDSSVYANLGAREGARVALVMQLSCGTGEEEEEQEQDKRVSPLTFGCPSWGAR